MISLKRRLILAWAWACGAVLVPLGCGGGDPLPRQPVSGTVTLAGEPPSLGHDHILANRCERRGDRCHGPTHQRRVPRPQGVGTGAGKYRVAISRLEEIATKSAANAQPGDGDAPAMKERVPAKYNAESTLNAEVSKGGKNVFDFSLDAK